MRLGYGDFVKCHRHHRKDSGPHVLHSPRKNKSAISSIPVTSSLTRRINRTSRNLVPCRDYREVQKSSCPQPYGRELRTGSSRTGNPTRPNRSPLYRDHSPLDYHPQPNLRVKKLRVDEHVHLQLWVLQVAYQQQQANNHLLPSLECLVLRLHISVQPRPISCSAWKGSSYAVKSH